MLTLATFLLTLAQETPGPKPEEPSSFTMPFFITMIVIFAAFYMLIALPQRKAQERKAQAVESMKRGSKIVSAGGIHGKVIRVDKDKGTAVVEVAKGVEMTFNKSSLTLVEDEKKEDGKGKTESGKK